MCHSSMIDVHFAGIALWVDLEQESSSGSMGAGDLPVEHGGPLSRRWAQFLKVPVPRRPVNGVILASPMFHHEAPGSRLHISWLWLVSGTGLASLLTRFSPSDMFDSGEW
jgi:hypothetical protein